MKAILRAAMALGLILAAQTAPARAEPSSRAFVYDKAIMALLGKIEGPDGYDEISNFAKLPPPKPISKMTIAEVIAYQHRVVDDGAASSAMGKYQFIRKTLEELVRRHRVDPQQPFDARTQDYLARMLLNDCNYYDPKADTVAIGNCLSRVWAALPVITGKRAGQSYYHGKAGNRALTTIPVVTAIINQRFTRPVDLRQPQRSRVALVAWPDDGKFADKVPLR